MGRLEWESVCHNTYRLKVYGGYIYKYYTSMSNTGDEEADSVSVAVSMCFVPQPD